MKNTEIELLIHEVTKRSRESEKDKTKKENSNFIFKWLCYSISAILGWCFIGNIDNTFFYVSAFIVLALFTLYCVVNVGIILFVFAKLKKQFYNKDFIYKLKDDPVALILNQNHLGVDNIRLFGRSGFIKVKNIVLNQDEMLKLTNILKNHFDDLEVERILLNSIKNGELRLSDLVIINYNHKEQFKRDEEEKELQPKNQKNEEEVAAELVSNLMKNSKK